MFNKLETQRIFEYSIVDDYLLTWIEAFLIDRKARGVGQGTLRFCQQIIKLLIYYCNRPVKTYSFVIRLPREHNPPLIDII